MKKLLLSLLLLNIFASSINGDTYTGSYSMILTANKVPEYVIKIPTKVDITNNETTINYSVMGDIYANQTLNIVFDDTTTITNGKQNVTLNIAQEKSTFNYNELTNSLITYTATITHNKLTSGNWTGRLNLVISLIGGQQ